MPSHALTSIHTLLTIIPEYLYEIMYLRLDVLHPHPGYDSDYLRGLISMC